MASAAGWSSDVCDAVKFRRSPGWSSEDQWEAKFISLGEVQKISGSRSSVNFMGGIWKQFCRSFLSCEWGTAALKLMIANDYCSGYEVQILWRGEVQKIGAQARVVILYGWVGGWLAGSPQFWFWELNSIFFDQNFKLYFFDHFLGHFFSTFFSRDFQLKFFSRDFQLKFLSRHFQLKFFSRHFQLKFFSRDFQLKFFSRDFQLKFFSGDFQLKFLVEIFNWNF